MTEDRSSRMYPSRPMVGVGAVVLREGAILLEQRGKPPAEGTWSIPGGLVELGETAEGAVVREVREETGLEVVVGPLLGLFQPVQRDADGRIRYHFVVIDFLAYYQAGDLRPGDDAAALAWVSPAELEHYELAEATRAMIKRALCLVQTGQG